MAEKTTSCQRCANAGGQGGVHSVLLIGFRSRGPVLHRTAFQRAPAQQLAAFDRSSTAIQNTAIMLRKHRDGCHHGAMKTLFDAAGGMEGMNRLAEAWHNRVMQDEVVSHAFSHGFQPDHIERLAAYWAEALGGPTVYSQSYGDETTVVKIHSGHGIHEDMDRRAIACF